MNFAGGGAGRHQRLARRANLRMLRKPAAARRLNLVRRTRFVVRDLIAGR